MGVAAFIALPSVVLMMMFGQTRIFFVMARDGLLPERLFGGPPEVPHAAHRDRLHRHRRDPRRGVPSGRQARRLFELGDIVRVRDGRARGSYPSQEGPEPPPPVPYAGSRGHRAAGDRRLHRAVPELPLLAQMVLSCGARSASSSTSAIRAAAAMSAAGSSRFRSSLPMLRTRSACRRCRARPRRATPRSATRRARRRQAP